MTEFSHLVPIDAIGRTGAIVLSADERARASIAMRLALASLDQLDVTATLERTAEGARLSGRLKAALTQNCAATGLPLTLSVAEAFDLRYLESQPVSIDAESEIELDDADCDILPLELCGVDVGEAAVQTLALALDPFPRHRDADRILKEKGVLSEGQAGPFAALAALKRS